MESKTPYEQIEQDCWFERNGERVKLNVSVAYSHDPGSTSPRKKPPTFRWGTLVDIAERGVCFRAGDRFFPDRVLSLQLKLNDQSGGIRMLGKVVWTRIEPEGQAVVGVQFIGMLPSDWRRLLAPGMPTADEP